MVDIIAYSFIVVGVFLVYILIKLISNLSGGKKKTTTKYKSTKPSFDASKLVHIQSVELPKDIERISKREIPSIVSKIYRVYEKLDYKTNVAEFTKAQWHTWQVSLIIKMYKAGMDMHVGSPQKVFPDELLNKSDKDLRMILNDILVKYKRDVETHRNRDFLSRDIIWTGRDVAILFLFLSKYQDFDKEIQ